MNSGRSEWTVKNRMNEIAAGHKWEARSPQPIRLSLIVSWTNQSNKMRNVQNNQSMDGAIGQLSLSIMFTLPAAAVFTCTYTTLIDYHYWGTRTAAYLLMRKWSRKKSPDIPRSIVWPRTPPVWRRKKREIRRRDLTATFQRWKRKEEGVLWFFELPSMRGGRKLARKYFRLLTREDE